MSQSRANFLELLSDTPTSRPVSAMRVKSTARRMNPAYSCHCINEKKVSASCLFISHRLRSTSQQQEMGINPSYSTLL